MNQPSDYSEYLVFCEETARGAGDILLSYFGRAKCQEKGVHDLVTEADFAAQEYIQKRVKECYPQHTFLGEENLPDAKTPASDKYRWIADPLDGTLNYVHKIPFFAVSLALEYHGEILVGVIYAPILRECFSAARGGGAYLNNSPIKVSGVRDLEHCLGATGFPPKSSMTTEIFETFRRAHDRCQTIRRTGSAALNLAYVAAGRHDMSWNHFIYPWDIAAGVLLVREAGGIVTNIHGGPFHVDDGSILATASAELHQQFQTLIFK